MKRKSPIHVKIPVGPSADRLIALRDRLGAPTYTSVIPFALRALDAVIVRVEDGTLITHEPITSGAEPHQVVRTALPW